MATYDEWKSTEPDPWEDWEPRVPTSELVSTFIRPQFDSYRGEAISDTEQDGDDWIDANGERDEEMAEDEPDYTDYPPEYDEWPELNDHADSLNIITGEVEE